MAPEFRTGRREAGGTVAGSLVDYVRLARVDHWFKNAFMAMGVVLAWFYEPDLLTWGAAGPLLMAVLATCLVASSNYVLNEVLDGPSDREHPVKKDRPVPSGRVATGLALLQWLLLAAAGIGLALAVNVPFASAALALWVMGMAYNVPPVRTKEVPYLDVLSESVNNPIRLLLGWFALIPDKMPPLSLLLAWWALGGFYMAIKRLAELRAIGDPARAAGYRRSFAHYDEHRLLASTLFYACACAFFGGIFMVRSKLELVLMVPLVAGHMAHYLALGLRPDSPAQAPERLRHDAGFMVLALLTFVAFVLLMFTEIPVLYDLFHFDPPKAPVLWRL